MEFDIHALRSRLAGRKIGSPLHHLETVDSTNRFAVGLAREGAPEGTTVIADHQTAGRGRLQRVWQSPPGCNLYLSVILRPAVAPSEASQITLLAGVAVAETLALLCPEDVAIKWPNDVLIYNKKVCGILAETAAAGASRAMIVGIGINVNIRNEDFDPGHRDAATSLLEETGRKHAREDLAFLLFDRLGKWYETFQHDGFAKVREEWLSRSDMAGKRVRISFRDEICEGFMEGIDGDGALLLADGQGNVQRITAGDATIIKE
jgi:BirA family transcriptional regulator, biotin operon repressor / biotin---[acetyl-CoA-carboxylase] ligase